MDWLLFRLGHHCVSLCLRIAMDYLERKTTALDQRERWNRHHISPNRLKTKTYIQPCTTLQLEKVPSNDYIPGERGYRIYVLTADAQVGFSLSVWKFILLAWKSIQKIIVYVKGDWHSTHGPCPNWRSTQRFMTVKYWIYGQQGSAFKYGMAYYFLCLIKYPKSRLSWFPA